jgi:hypothetical protein
VLGSITGFAGQVTPNDHEFGARFRGLCVRERVRGPAFRVLSRRLRCARQHCRAHCVRDLLVGLAQKTGKSFCWRGALRVRRVRCVLARGHVDGRPRAGAAV